MIMIITILIIMVTYVAIEANHIIMIMIIIIMVTY